MGLVLRRAALALLAVALLAAASVQPALAAAPPTLTGESFHAFGTGAGGGLGIRCEYHGDGTTTFSFGAFSTAQGPYAGNFSEEGEVTVRNLTGEVLSLTAEFTIESASGQVTGTARLEAPVANGHQNADCTGSTPPMLDTAVLDLSYSATITTPSGVFADRGRMSFNLDSSGSVSAPIHELHETFSSSLAATEQRGSVLLGKRTPGASFSGMSSNAKRAVAFPLYFPATVRKLHAFVDGRGGASGSQTLRGVLYAHGSGGAPGALLGRTFQFSVPAGMSGRWLELYLAPPIRLNAGVYWLGLHSGATNRVARFAWDPKDNSRRFNVDYYPDGPSNPFGSAALDNQQMSIFASGSY
jgi:hypothetical protein